MDGNGVGGIKASLPLASLSDLTSFCQGAVTPSGWCTVHGALPRPPFPSPDEWISGWSEVLHRMAEMAEMPGMPGMPGTDLDSSTHGASSGFGLSSVGFIVSTALASQQHPLEAPLPWLEII